LCLRGRFAPDQETARRGTHLAGDQPRRQRGGVRLLPMSVP
jgi:hypothetical protein